MLLLHEGMTYTSYYVIFSLLPEGEFTDKKGLIGTHI